MTSYEGVEDGTLTRRGRFASQKPRRSPYLQQFAPSWTARALRILFCTVLLTSLTLNLILLLVPLDECEFHNEVRVEYKNTEDLPVIDPGVQWMENSRSVQLFNGGRNYSVRVLCFVLTGPGEHWKAKHVKRTWGRRCDKILFMSSQKDDTLPTVALPGVKEGRDWLWAKTKESLKYIWEHHADDADWFLKADDDTYVVMENLKTFLRDYDPDDPHYFGCRVRFSRVYPNVNFGGSGYVLSKEALKMLIEGAIDDPNKCRQDHGGDEDAELGICLHNVGIHAEDTRDPYGRHRFMQAHPEKAIGSTEKREFIVDEEKQGLDCCAEDLISFHRVYPHQQYMLEYFFYHFKLSDPTPHRTQRGTQFYDNNRT